MGLETLLAVGAVTQAAGSVVGGVTKAGDIRGTTDFNAAALERQARIDRITGATQAHRIRREGRRLVGTQRAIGGASGVDVGQGSPLLIMLDTIQRSAEDAALAKWRAEVGAQGQETQAEATRVTGRTAARRALISGISGVGDAAIGFATRRAILKKKGVIE